MSRCCINFTLQLMQLKHISDPSVFKATNNAVEIRLNNSDRFVRGLSEKFVDTISTTEQEQ